MLNVTSAEPVVGQDTLEDAVSWREGVFVVGIVLLTELLLALGNKLKPKIQQVWKQFKSSPPTPPPSQEDVESATSPSAGENPSSSGSAATSQKNTPKDAAAAQPSTSGQATNVRNRQGRRAAAAAAAAAGEDGGGGGGGGGGAATATSFSTTSEVTGRTFGRGEEAGLSSASFPKTFSTERQDQEKFAKNLNFLSQIVTRSPGPCSLEAKESAYTALEHVYTVGCPVARDKYAELQMDKELFGFIRRSLEGEALNKLELRRVNRYFKEWTQMLKDEEISSSSVPREKPPPLPLRDPLASRLRPSSNTIVKGLDFSSEGLKATQTSLKDSTVKMKKNSSRRSPLKKILGMVTPNKLKKNKKKEEAETTDELSSSCSSSTLTEEEEGTVKKNETVTRRRAKESSTEKRKRELREEEIRLKTEAKKLEKKKKAFAKQVAQQLNSPQRNVSNHFDTAEGQENPLSGIATDSFEMEGVDILSVERGEQKEQEKEDKKEEEKEEKKEEEDDVSVTQSET